MLRMGDLLMADDGWLTRVERETIRSEEAWNVEMTAPEGRDILKLLAHADAADGLLRESRDKLLEVASDFFVGDGEEEWQDVFELVAKLTQALGEEAKSG